MMTLSNYILGLRKEAGLSQRELARKAAVSHTEISRIEKGEREKPSPSVLNKLAPILGISVEQLMEAAGYLCISTDGNSQSAIDLNENTYTYRSNMRIPILGNNSGLVCGNFDIDKLIDMDFAVRVVDDRLAFAGLYMGDIALCRENVNKAGKSQVLAVEQTNGTQKQIVLTLNDELECHAEANVETRVIGKVEMVVRNVDWGYIKTAESLKKWMDVVHTADKSGFSPDQVNIIIKAQAQCLKKLGQQKAGSKAGAVR
ncbi:MAG: helix-turn-helix transcriptional regulator [Bacillota bacterium]|nr:helix-turn-helix transcriptional regulator [Bacillota bacterium]